MKIKNKFGENKMNEEEKSYLIIQNEEISNPSKTFYAGEGSFKNWKSKLKESGFELNEEDYRLIEFNFGNGNTGRYIDINSTHVESKNNYEFKDKNLFSWSGVCFGNDEKIRGLLKLMGGKNEK